LTVRVGTRGSALARAQAGLVTAALERLGMACEVVTIHTLGDRHPTRPTMTLGIGAFVKDLEGALLDHRIDLAVHSAKDLPGEDTPGVVLAAFLPREDPADVLVTRVGTGLQSLAPGAVIGTDSPRRRAFLLAARPDLIVRGIRGNVDTRLRKLRDGEVDGLVLAAAGLVRLGLAGQTVERFDASVMLPAVGQGVLAVQTRADAVDLRHRLAMLDDGPTHAAVEAERAFLGGLGGGCQRPIGALCTVEGARLTLEGAVLDPSGAQVIRDRAEGTAADPAGLGAALAARLLARGAERLMFEVAP
jgi:hydroxymethylbilane synthase